MARIAGVDLPKEKRVEVGLTYVFGIGPASAKRIIKFVGVNPDTRVKDLTEDEVYKLQGVLNNGMDGELMKVEGDLRREVAQNIKRLADIQSYRGIRHRKNLPVRGQRTSTNARTRKGPKRLVGGKK